MGVVNHQGPSSRPQMGLCRMREDLLVTPAEDMHKLQAEKREFHQHMRDIGYEGIFSGVGYPWTPMVCKRMDWLKSCRQCFTALGVQVDF